MTQKIPFALSRTRLTQIVGAVAVLAMLAGLVLVLFDRDHEKTLTAQFPRTVSLYEGSDVRILGVKVGTVETVRPAGDKVLVTMTYDEELTVPADAKAAIVSPSIVGDRFVQLTPVYRGGEAMADGARLGLEQTATPLELDQIYSSLNDLSVALGPTGVNQAKGGGEGALTRLLDTTASNFGGQGERFNQTLKDLGRLTKTLSNNKDDLFGTARQLEVFVRTLAENDTTVREFNDSLASAADLLEGERDDLSAALRNLGTALTEVRGFVQDNKRALSTNIKGLNRVAGILVKRRKALDETLEAAPNALNNLYLAYNPSTGTLDTRNNTGQALDQLQADPSVLLCGLVSTAPRGSEACNQIKDSLAGQARGGGAGLPNLPGLGRAGALAAGQDGPRDVQYVDRSLAGLVEVDR